MSFSELFYHIVLGVEKQDAKLNNITTKLVVTRLANVMTELGGEVLSAKMLEDHAHLLVFAPTGGLLEDIVSKLKNDTSKMVSDSGRKEALVWKAGFGAVSVSKSHIDIVKNYIETQEERHSAGKTNATLEKIDE